MKREKLCQFLLLIAICLFSFSCHKAEKTKVAANKMQDFVINISKYCKSYNDSFLIIPQNGLELCYNNGEMTDGLNTSYLNAVDGFGVEELFYNGKKPSKSDDRLTIANQIKAGKRIMVSDFFQDASKIDTYRNKASENEFLYFARTSDNYYYQYIPSTIYNENANDILSLKDAQNYLYLISTDNYSSKESFLNGLRNTNFDLLIIDLFWENTPLTSSEIESLKTKANGGKRLVIAYMNIGSAEKFRYYWQNNWKLHHPSWLKKKYPGYPDEIYVEYWNQEWQNIIYGNSTSYTDKILNAGFDGVYLDNVEAFYTLYHSN